MNSRKAIIILLIFVLSFSMASCTFKKAEDNENEKKNLKLTILMKTNENSEVMKSYIEKFKEMNKDINVEFKEFKNLDEEIIKDLTNGKADLILSDRSDLIELHSNGLINNLNEIYKKNELERRMYDVVKTYGRIGESYFGIGIDCRTYELIINKENANGLIGDTKDNNDIKKAIAVMKEKGVTLPILCGQGIEYEDVVISSVMNRLVNYNTLLEDYDGTYEHQREKDNIEKGVEIIGSIVKSQIITEKDLVAGSKEDITKVSSGKIPFLISDSVNLKDIESQQQVILMNNMFAENTKIINLVDVKNILSISTASQNKDSYGRFIKYVSDEKNLEKLVQSNVVTFDKFVNERLGGKYKEVSNHINLSNENNIIFKYGISKENYTIIKDKIYAAMKAEEKLQE